MIREEALSALSHSASAALVLGERLLEIKNAEAIHELARAIIPQASQLSPKLLERMSETYAALCIAERLKETEAQRASEERRKVLLSVLRAAHATILAKIVLVAAGKLRKKNEHRKAFELLRSVAGVSGWSDEHRLEMALAGLSFSPKDLGRTARNADFNLHALQEIFFGGRTPVKDVFNAVWKDTSLNRRTQYYIGFHFVERMQTEREFGHFVLEQLAESRSDEGKLARDKLIIEGLLQVKNGQIGKMGILEERAKVMRSTEERVVTERIKDQRKVTKSVKASPTKILASAKKAAPSKKVAQPAPLKKVIASKKPKQIEKQKLKKAVLKKAISKSFKTKLRK
jgi:hypothetical protein